MKLDDPYAYFVRRYLEQSSRYQLFKNITLAAAKNAGFDRVAANKFLRDAIRAKFGRDAVSYNKNHNPTARSPLTKSMKSPMTKSTITTTKSTMRSTTNRRMTNERTTVLRLDQRPDLNPGPRG